MGIRGWVYVMTNKAMPGLVKIGYSTKDPVLRAEELGTGSPHPYEVEFDVLVEQPQAIEQHLHTIFAPKREGKEWFRCGIIEAIQEMRKAVEGTVIAENSHGRSPAPDFASKKAGFCSAMGCSSVVWKSFSGYGYCESHYESAINRSVERERNRLYSIARVKEELEQIAKQRKDSPGE